MGKYFLLRYSPINPAHPYTSWIIKLSTQSTFPIISFPTIPKMFSSSALLLPSWRQILSSKYCTTTVGNQPLWTSVNATLHIPPKTKQNQSSISLHPTTYYWTHLSTLCHSFKFTIPNIPNQPTNPFLPSFLSFLLSPFLSLSDCSAVVFSLCRVFQFRWSLHCSAAQLLSCSNICTIPVRVTIYIPCVHAFAFAVHKIIRFIESSPKSFLLIHITICTRRKRKTNENPTARIEVKKKKQEKKKKKKKIHVQQD